MSKDTTVSDIQTYIIIKNLLLKFQNMSFKEQNKLVDKFDKKIKYLKRK